MLTYILMYFQNKKSVLFIGNKTVSYNVKLDYLLATATGWNNSLAAVTGLSSVTLLAITGDQTCCTRKCQPTAFLNFSALIQDKYNFLLMRLLALNLIWLNDPCGTGLLLH